MSDSILPPADEHLTNGWEPDLPADDTLKRRAVLAHASWPLAVAAALGRASRRTDRWSGALLGHSGDLTNPVVLTQPVAQSDAGTLVDEIGDLIPPGTTYFVLNPWLDPDLTPYGLARLGHPPLMVRFPAQHPASAPHGVRVAEVLDGPTLALAERVLIEGYPMPGSRPGDVLQPGLLDGSTRVWLGYVDGEPAAVAAAHLAPGATLVEYVASLPGARGRGAGAAVTWAATLADPGTPAVLVASDDGRPVYERMGYVALERWTAWLRPGSG